jgi:hypothetical protein
MNKLGVSAAFAAVVAAGGAGFASWSGGKVTSEIQTHTANTLKAFPGVKLVDQKVTKGWMNSTHEITVELGCAPAAADAASAPSLDSPKSEPLQFTWRDRIQHGPVPGGKNIGFASIDSELVLPPKIATEVTKVFGEKPPFQAHTVLGFAGGYTTTLTSPAIKHVLENESQLEWQGLSMVVSGELKGGIAAGGSYTMDMPGFTLNAGKDKSTGSVKVGAVHMQGKVNPDPQSTLWINPHKGVATLASINFSMAPPMGKPVNVQLLDMKIAQESKIDKGLMGSVSQLSGKMSVNDFVVDKFDIQSSITNLHAATYQQMLNRFISQISRCDKPIASPGELEKIAMQEMEKDLVALMAHQLEYSVDKLALEIGGKNAELSYKLGAQGVTSDDATVPIQQLLTSKGYVHAGLKVQMGWIEQVVQKVLEAKTADTEKNAKAKPEQIAEVMGSINKVVDKLVAKNLLIREGDTLKSNAKLQQGQVTVNDKPVGLPDLMGAM